MDNKVIMLHVLTSKTGVVVQNILCLVKIKEGLKVLVC